MTSAGTPIAGSTSRTSMSLVASDRTRAAPGLEARRSSRANHSMKAGSSAALGANAGRRLASPQSATIASMPSVRFSTVSAQS